MSNSPFKTVTIAGGTGDLGYAIAEAFLNDGSYSVKILRRKPEKENEKAKLLASKGAEIIYADYSQNDDLVKAIKGTDVSPLLAAAKDASVKRFIPSEFTGRFKSGDHFIIDDKDKFREELEKSGLEYTYIEVGIFQEFFDWLGFDIKNKKATFYVDANEKIPTTSLNDIGKYTVENLKIPEARNARINIAGSFLSLNEYLEIFEKASGSKWEVIVDKDVRHRYKNKIEPVPQFLDYYKAVLLQEGEVNLELDNDKFSFTPKPVTEFIEKLVKQAS
ncbi:NAD(P)-binding protein [Rhizophagus irregularis]|uniref:NAD(P)-binding protein n=1 Tax=Rhizophagus irregularis TaxID=588596 RepID=A0A2N1NC00_9GLOM|nr:NAD(P)-binding protein [Rhizophagus irregularis]